MTPRPLILLTNDDGVEAPGLAAVAEALLDLGEVEVVAPSGERSAVSHAISLSRDMHYRRHALGPRIEAHALDGSPADCVKLGVTQLCPRRPDLVVSGINPGANIGNNILYSGTVAGAREGAMLGIPSLAVSIDAHRSAEPPHYESGADVARRVARLILDRGLPPGVMLNANLPNLGLDALGALTITRQSRFAVGDVMEARAGQDGRSHFFRNVGIEHRPGEEGEDFDDRCLERGDVSITPLHYDLTHHGLREELRSWISAEGEGAS